jgi:hypothetical protein
MSYEFSYFGGKAMMAPPPGPPPKPQPAIYKEGKWVCDTPKPTAGPGKYYHCCPSGWTEADQGDTKPCKKDKGLMACGPLPTGVDQANSVCCENLKKWIPAGPPGGPDPCLQAARAAGVAVPGVMETMLAPDVIAEPEPVISPGMIILGLVVVVSMIGLTVWLKFS